MQTILPVVQLPGAEAGRCTIQRAGHNVNPVQARLATERPGTPGTLVRTAAGVVLRPADGGEDLVLRCHRPEALDEVLERFGPDGWRVSTSLLLNDRGVGISVACGDTALSPCATTPGTGSRTGTEPPASSRPAGRDESRDEGGRR